MHGTSPLKPLYAAMEILAGLALIAIGGVILANLVVRLFGRQVPAAEDFSSFALVALLFLGLAPTYRRSDHIRVGLIVDRIGGTPRRLLEIVLLAIAAAGVSWAAWWCAVLAYDSHRFGDVAQGLLAIPLAIPQASMGIGLAVFALALAEDLVLAIAGRTPTSMSGPAAEADAGPAFER